MDEWVKDVDCIFKGQSDQFVKVDLGDVERLLLDPCDEGPSNGSTRGNISDGFALIPLPPGIVIVWISSVVKLFYKSKLWLGGWFLCVCVLLYSLRRVSRSVDLTCSIRCCRTLWRSQPKNRERERGRGARNFGEPKERKRELKRRRIQCFSIRPKLERIDKINAPI